MTYARRLLTPVATAVIATVTALAMTVMTSTHAHAALPSGAPSGIDVSANNHISLAGIDWNAVKSDGQSYAFVKATEGTTYVNDKYLGDVTAAAAAGLKVGTYHYARPAGDAKKQAASFASQIALAPGQTLPPVLDIEVTEGLNQAQLTQWIHTFMSEVKSLTGRTPMLYTYKYFWIGEMGNTTEFSQYPLWLAAYQDTAPDPVGGWDKLAFWQRSGSGKVAGIQTDVDMNLFNGTASQLDSFSSGNYIDFGGILENLVIPGVDLSGDAGALIAGIIALAAGAAALPAVVQAAEDAGVGTGGNGLVTLAQDLLKSGAISTGDLEKLAKNGATTGDLALYLDNAEHLQELSSAEVNADEAAADATATAATAATVAEGAGVKSPSVDPQLVADLLNALL